jgi:hypothetical protein
MLVRAIFLTLLLNRGILTDFVKYYCYAMELMDYDFFDHL